MKWIRKSKMGIGLCLTAALVTGCSSQEERAQTEEEPIKDVVLHEPVTEADIATTNMSKVIKIALLLDTSGSMDGLIDQAKSQLWKIVNQLALAKKGDNYAEIKIALYEYGNDKINHENGYVRQVVGLTDDLDEISKELFALTTDGGSEFCGQVIANSLDELDWEKETGGLQVMFIAGNEEFTQGGVNYETACANASRSDIIVNTIYCGDLEEGIRTKWKHGADLTDGFYGSIEMDETTVYIETPYDSKIQALNEKLNDTYLAYGNQKTYYLQNQTTQDRNASSYGLSNEVERTVTKSSHLYKNDTWDLVDAKKNDDFDINQIEEETLPDEMKGMTATEKEAYIELKDADRLTIQDEIQALNLKRLAYIEEKKAEMGLESNGLDQAMLEAIKKQAMDKNFTFEIL